MGVRAVPMTRRAAALVVSVACVIACLSYAPMIGAGLTYEDANVLTRLEKPFEVPSRWLTYATFRWTTVDPDWARAVTLGVHLVNGLLVYGLLRLAWGHRPALAAAVVFLWHPLATEAVLMFNGRADVLLTTGWLLAALGAWRGAWWLAAVGLLWASVSKEIGIAGVGIVAVIALMRLAWWRVAIGGAIGAALAYVWLWPTVSWWMEKAPQVDRWVFAWLQLKAVSQLALLLVWPVGLSIDHDPLVVPDALALLIWVGLVAVGCGAIWRGRVAVLAVTWIACAIAPRFFVFGVETISEHQIYPALVGGVVLLVWGVIRLGDVLAAWWACAQYRPWAGWTPMEEDRCEV